MSQYSIVQAIYMSFYSKNVYRDVAKNWKINKAYFSLLMSIIIGCIIILMIFKKGDRQFNLIYLFSYYITQYFLSLGIFSLIYIYPGQLIAASFRLKLTCNELHKIAIISFIPGFVIAQFFNINDVFKHPPLYIISLSYLFFGIVANRDKAFEKIFDYFIVILKLLSFAFIFILSFYTITTGNDLLGNLSNSYLLNYPIFILILKLVYSVAIVFVAFFATYKMCKKYEKR